MQIRCKLDAEQCLVGIREKGDRKKGEEEEEPFPKAKNCSLF